MTFLVIVLLIATLIIIARVTSRSIDGIGCDFAGSATYHVHAHLTFVVSGRTDYPPANVGFRYLHLCVYWVHTHDASGIIHIEAPKRIAPTLKAFFDIWGQPLSRAVAWKYHVSRGHAMLVYVGKNLFTGEPGRIKLYNHTAVTIEIGPPFIPPPPPDFGGL
jgi:hypothetical protein